ncbi:hypothetical protein HMPREF1051_1296 [Neisseria sicca VK64]|uniref:Uncharacterized protein n=1 Tax=Neisseria sicca VK64 TaxID=1095748 RepID=I2NX51_NEISI|nr:hypothetical protein HMPREF1051_1296 [Neisseria sicca VK64]
MSGFGCSKRKGRLKQLPKTVFRRPFYSGLNLNQYGVASPCRTIVD